MVIQKIFVDGIIFLDFEIRCIDTVNVSASKYMFKILIFRTMILGDWDNDIRRLSLKCLN